VSCSLEGELTEKLHAKIHMMGQSMNTTPDFQYETCSRNHDGHGRLGKGEDLFSLQVAGIASQFSRYISEPKSHPLDRPDSNIAAQ
jgi:hypothetical protein